MICKLLRLRHHPIWRVRFQWQAIQYVLFHTKTGLFLILVSPPNMTYPFRSLSLPQVLERVEYQELNTHNWMGFPHLGLEHCESIIGKACQWRPCAFLLLGWCYYHGRDPLFKNWNASGGSYYRYCLQCAMGAKLSLYRLRYYRVYWHYSFLNNSVSPLSQITA